MKIIPTPLSDCFLLQPDIYRDNRGYFLESFNKKRFQSVTGLETEFVQDNLSVSKKGVLRGLHFQKGVHAQAKLVHVLKGRVQDVVVDLRADSPTYKKAHSLILDAQSGVQLFVPRGFAHGFLALTDEVIFSYKCDAYYAPEAEAGIIYDDPELAIEWELPKDELILSEKDLLLPRMSEVLGS
ncbi:dTDP-4-dehydrorhamnose 3,5-epimerase [Robertkochia aurantiaca]|uniref:dTDP-4-dehydrorhamnose 3,5-epimerase n=1 Tax=Robertkochia aurantiaca TaxID=2873700 RepID=UPI001CCB54C0|nr:dTDP-4-dehydrorhamnose 3,5-epimerase [Robertkochia sp. 3YJGBD-33]